MDAAPNQFFAPTLEPEFVAEQIADALNSGLSQFIMLPALANLIPWLRVWPDWMKRGFELVSFPLIFRSFGRVTDLKGTTLFSLFSQVGHTDDTVSEKSMQRAAKNGYGKDWEGEDKALYEKGLANILKQKSS